MAAYTYRFHDLVTNQALAELPLAGVSISRALNAVGAFDATLDLADARVVKANPLAATLPARTALFVDRGGVIVWAGIVWTRDYDSEQRSLRLAGAELGSYFATRYNHISIAFGPVPIARTFVARGMVDAIQDTVAHGAGADIGVTTVLADDATSSTITTGNSFASFNSDRVDKIISDLGGVTDGFDWAYESAYDGSGNPTKVFRAYAPHQGVRAVASALEWEYGPDTRANIVRYTWPEDGARMANSVEGIGAGEGVFAKRVRLTDTALITGGYPLLEEPLVNKDVTDTITLTAMVSARLEQTAQPVVLPKVTVFADADPVFGAWGIGDEALIRIADLDRFPSNADDTPGYEGFRRIVGWRLHVPDGGGPELVELTLGEIVS